MKHVQKVMSEAKQDWESFDCGPFFITMQFGFRVLVACIQFKWDKVDYVQVGGQHVRQLDKAIWQAQQ